MPKRHKPLLTVVRQYGAAFGFDSYVEGKRRQHRYIAETPNAAKKKAQGKWQKLSSKAQKGQAALNDLTTERFASFLKWEAQQQKSIMLGKLMGEFLSLKKHLSTLYYKKTSDDLKLLTDALGTDRSVTDIETSEIQTWVYGRRAGERRRFNLRALAIALWSYAWRQGYVSGPQTAAHKVEACGRPTGKVNILRAKDIEKLIQLVPEPYLPWLVIGIFTGIRSEEMAPEVGSKKSPLMWQDFRWEKKIIRLRKETAKTGRKRRPQPRSVPMPDALLQWLAPYRQRKGRVCPERQPNKELTKKLAKQMGWEKWPDNCLRDTCISCKVALSRDRARVADESGNSVAMISASYEDEIEIEEAERIMRIVPEVEGKVLAIAG